MLNLDVLRNHLKNSWRYLLKDKQFTLLNLLELSTGLACALLISLWVRSELNFDRFYENDDQLYEVMIHEKAGNRIATSNATGDQMGETLLRDLPEVETAVTTTPASWFQTFSLTAGSNTMSAGGNFVSGDYFHAFSVRLIQGRASEVLNNKNAVAISHTLAVKLFREPELAIGKIMEWKWQAFSGKCMVTGVFADFPASSSQQHDFLLSMDAWNQIVPKGDKRTSSGPFDNFVVLKKGTAIDHINQKLAGLTKTTFNDSTSTLFLRKYSDAYLFGNYENGVQTGGKITYVRLFSCIAIIILLVACINFMNLSTAKASMRMKEVGVKKALGARRGTLVLQFLRESMVMSFLALSIAIFITWALLPQFSHMTGKALSLHFDAETILIMCGAAAGTGLLAGSYPAFHLSRFNPSLTLKGGLASSWGEVLVRKGLVVFQFSISIVFIVSVTVVYRQISYVQEKSPGYDKDNVVYFEMNGRVAEQAESFLAQLKSIPGVINASSIQQKMILPAMLPGNGAGVRWEGKNADDKIRFFRMPVNYDLIETMNIQIAEGRSFSKRYGNEASNIILNEAAVKAMELRDPIGKMVMISGQERQVVGVAKNFHFNSLHEAVRPFILYISPAETMLVMARVTAGNQKETLQNIQAFHKSFNPGYAFNYQFLDYDFQRQYASEQLVAQLAKYFAALAIIISCLGLYGLAAFTANRRRQEIGVRKVLGATAGNVVTMLTKDFMILMIIAMSIAFPLGWWLTNQWLQNFAYHIHISAGIFIITTLLMLMIILTTIGFQSLKAARMNPTDALKVQ